MASKSKEKDGAPIYISTVDGSQMVKATSNALSYKPATSATQVFRVMIEYSFITQEQVKDACMYAIKRTDGRCIYCGVKCLEHRNIRKRQRYKDGTFVDTLVEDNEWFIVNKFQFDHLMASADLCIPYKGALALACDKCNNDKSDIPLGAYIIVRHGMRDAQLKAKSDKVYDVYIDDRQKHLDFVMSFIETYHQESMKNGTIDLFDNAIGFDSQEMMDRLGHLDYKRIEGLDTPTSYRQFDEYWYDHRTKTYSFEPRDLTRMSEAAILDYLYKKIKTDNRLSTQPRIPAKLVCDLTDPYLEKYFQYDVMISMSSNGKTKNARLPKVEVQRIVKKYLDGGDFSNITIPEDVYRRLDDYLYDVFVQDEIDTKRLENVSKSKNRAYSSIYSTATLSLELILDIFGHDVEMPRKTAFKHLHGIGDESRIPYSMWSTVLEINGCFGDESSKNAQYTGSICHIIRKHGWNKPEELLKAFINGDLAREIIRYDLSNVPVEERVRHKLEKNNKGFHENSNFYESIKRRVDSFNKALKIYLEEHDDFTMDSMRNTPTTIEMAREFNIEDSLVYNELEKPYNMLRSKFNRPSKSGRNTSNPYPRYAKLEEKWIATKILDFEHGLTGLNKSIKDYVISTSDEFHGRDREQKRNDFSNSRKAILNIMIPVIREKIYDEGYDSEWVRRGWTSDPVQDDELEDWASNSTFAAPSSINAEDVAKTVKSITKSDWIYEQVKGHEWNWTKGLDEFIAVLDEVVSQTSHGVGIEDYIPDDHDRKAIYWTMMSKSDGISKDYDRSEWLKKIKWFFNEDDLPTIRRSDPGKEPIYSLIFRLSKHRHVDFVELCELMSMIVGTDKSSIQTLDECIDLESIESKLDELDYESYIDTIGIRSIRTEAVQRAYHSIVGDEPAWKVNKLPYKKKQKLCGGLGKIMKTYRWYLENIHHEIPSSVISRIPDTVSTILLFIDQQQ